MLYGAIPETMRPHAACSVDAIVDAQDRIWLLEMNCNPQLHPDIYDVMLESLLA